MYKLFVDLKDGSNRVFYQNGSAPHLWLLAMDGKRTCEFEEFTDRLIAIASEVGDDVFTDEIANLIAALSTNEIDVLEISGPSCNYDLDELKKQVQAYDFDPIFGTKVDKIEYYATEESKEYFKQQRKNYRSQYRSVTNILVTINVIVFIVNLIFGYSAIQFIPSGVGLSNGFVWLQMFFAAFTHFSFLHVFFNMSFLLSMGPMLEQILGRTKFTILYIVSIFISGISVVLFTSGLHITAGASGALYGLFAYFVCYMLKYGTDAAHKRNVLSSFGVNILITFMISGISVAGHIGGAVAGIVFFFIFNRR